MAEHLCHGGVWNSKTKQFECEHNRFMTDQPKDSEWLNEQFQRTPAKALLRLVIALDDAKELS